MKKMMFNDRYGLTKAVLEGRKTMTRRLINPIPDDCTANHKGYWGAYWSDEPMSLVVDQETGGIYCEYCGNGVRWFDRGYHYNTKYKVGEIVAVAQSYEQVYQENGLETMDMLVSGMKDSAGWKNKMFVRADLMPHQIRITGIRCERLQDISDDDCIAEGIYLDGGDDSYLPHYFYDYPNNPSNGFSIPREAFASLIDKVSGRGTWDRNPWVLVYEFELEK